MEPQERYHASPADYLAVERTFLAWIRTGLALMALGFVLARFGLFLQEFNIARPDLHAVSYGYSLWFGTLLILLGVLVSSPCSAISASSLGSRVAIALSTMRPRWPSPWRYYWRCSASV